VDNKNKFPRFSEQEKKFIDVYFMTLILSYSKQFGHLG